MVLSRIVSIDVQVFGIFPTLSVVELIEGVRWGFGEQVWNESIRITMPMKTVSYVLSGLFYGSFAGFLAGAAFLAIAATLSSEAYDGMGLILFGMIGAPISRRYSPYSFISAAP